MSENLKAFLKLASENKELQEKILELAKKEPGVEKDGSEMFKLAAEYGIELTKEDVEEQKETMSDEELEAVAGGGGCGCASFGGGGGNPNANDGLYCGCAGPGLGTLNLTARGETVPYENKVIVCTGAGEGACGCLGLGAGATNGVDTLNIPGDPAEREAFLNSGNIKYKGE